MLSGNSDSTALLTVPFSVSGGSALVDPAFLIKPFNLSERSSRRISVRSLHKYSMLSRASLRLSFKTRNSFVPVSIFSSSFFPMSSHRNFICSSCSGVNSLEISSKTGFNSEELMSCTQIAPHWRQEVSELGNSFYFHFRLFVRHEFADAFLRRPREARLRHFFSEYNRHFMKNTFFNSLCNPSVLCLSSPPRLSSWII